MSHSFEIRTSGSYQKRRQVKRGRSKQRAAGLRSGSSAKTMKTLNLNSRPLFGVATQSGYSKDYQRRPKAVTTHTGQLVRERYENPQGFRSLLEKELGGKSVTHVSEKIDAKPDLATQFLSGYWA